MDDSDMDPRVDEVLIGKLEGLVTNIKWSREDVLRLFSALMKRFDSKNVGEDRILWMTKMLHCIEINYITSGWTSPTGKTLIELIQDQSVRDEDLKTYLADDTEKNLDEILEEIRQEKLNQVDAKLLDDVRDIVSSVHDTLTSRTDGSQYSGLKQDLLKVCRAAEKTHFRPRLTQMVSWCLMALSETGRLIQVGTGEGKSCIVAMFAAFRAMRGEQVDIMSSSLVLAERDLDTWRNFYDELKISVDCNTNKLDKDLKKSYECQVVYGTAENFAGDWLRQHFQRTDIFGKRTFQCAIVDEVDSLMLDKGHHVVYLGTEMPALQNLYPLLAFIWDTVNQYSKIGRGRIVGRKHHVFKVVLENIKGEDNDKLAVYQIAEDTGVLAKGSVEELRRNQRLRVANNASITANQLAEYFKRIERRFPSCQFALHCKNNNGTIEDVNQELQRENEERQSLLLIDGGFCQYMYSDSNSVLKAAEAEVKQALHFTPCELRPSESRCYVPGFFSDLVKSKLKIWIINAFYAQTLTMDHQYIKEKQGIVPVDFSCTGVVENYMQWTDGLQQFLEMKHESKLSDMTAITNYLSNVGLLQKYGGQIYGMSGTLGRQAETETLQKIYTGIKTCQIPSFKRRKLFEVEGEVVVGEEEWIENICDEVTAQTNSTSYRGRRAVLVICETIKRANALHENLGDKVPNKMLYTNNNMDNSTIFSKKLDAGEVIIATNLAGRGTDLQVSDEVKAAGGLFVVQTFLPRNARVEAQAFGRTARQGSPGSAKLIVCSDHLSEPLQLLILIKELLSLLENLILIDFTPVCRHLFAMLLRLYQKGHGDEQIIAMCSTLSRILMKNSKSGIKTVKALRDISVAEELSSYVVDDIPKIKKKEELFNQYLEILEDVYESSNQKPEASDLSALNEFWGMWLLTNFKDEDSLTVLKQRLTEDLNRAREKLQQRESPSSNLHHYTAFGNDLREKGEPAESIKMYTKAIQEDHCWAAIAYYNRAFASLKQKNRDQDSDCIDGARNDLQNALKSVDFYWEQTEVTYRFATQQTCESRSASMTRFDKHTRARYTVLLRFRMNINEALQKLTKASDMGGTVKVDEYPVFFLDPLAYLLPLVVHLREIATLVRSRDLLRTHQLMSQPSFDLRHELGCLESLGLTHVYKLDTLFSLGGFFSKIGRRIRRAVD